MIKTKSGEKHFTYSEIISLNTTFLLFLFRTAFPFLKYPFLVLFVLNIIYFAFSYRSVLVKELLQFAKDFTLILALSLILLLSFLLSNKIYLTIFKDVLNITIILTEFFMLYLAVNSRKALNYFVSSLIDLIIFFGFVLSLIRLADLFWIITLSDSDLIDYNFSLLPALLGIVGVIYKQAINVSTVKRIFYGLCSVFLIFEILLSGSRRGMIVLIVITVLLLIFTIVAYLLRKRVSSIALLPFIKASLSNFIMVLIVSASCYLAVFHTSYRLKENVMDLIRSKNVAAAKYDIAYNINRYSSVIFGEKNDFAWLYARLWSANLDMKDPDSGWGSKIHKTIFPLTGDNVGKIPGDVKGYLMDSTCNASLKNGKAYSKTYFEGFRVDDGDIVEASVFCFVSKDFNGDSVKLRLEGSIGGDLESQYNTFLSDKYEKKSSTNLIYNGNFQKGTLNWENYYAYTTEYQLIETPIGKGIRISRTTGDEDWSMMYTGRPLIYYAGHEYKFMFFYRVVKGVSIPFNIGWWVDDAGQGFLPTLNLPLHIRQLDNGWNEASCSYRFKEKHMLLMTFLNSLRNNSIVEFADIRLYDLDISDTLPVFHDEVRNLWQKLTVKGICKNGRVRMSLSFLKDSVMNFNSLKGHVIFAYPQINVYKKKYNTTIPVFGQNDIVTPYESPNYTSSKDLLHYSFIPGNSNMHNLCNSTINNLKNNNKSFSNMKMSGTNGNLVLADKYIQAGLFNLNFNSLPDTIDTDFIRAFVSGFISEDTTYLGYKANLNVDTLSSSFAAGRLVRWRFAIKIYIQEYNLFEKVFGGGFKFLNWYGNFFNGDKNKSGNPHNPFLSVLLYSGVIGISLYLFLFYRTFVYYYIYLKEYYVLSLFFAIVFFFSFFSGESAFDPPMMGFFIILPHFINSVYRKTSKI
jgi:hypothetical protein